MQMQAWQCARSRLCAQTVRIRGRTMGQRVVPAFACICRCSEWRAVCGTELALP